MNYPQRSFKLYLANRFYVLGIPVIIMTSLALFGIIVSAAFNLLGDESTTSFRYYGDSGILFALPGFHIALGAIAVNRNFAMALAFGSTRRDFWLGTSFGFIVTSAMGAVASVILLWLEKLTAGWGYGIYSFKVTILGNGSAIICFAAIFALLLMNLYLGAALGTIYRAFGKIATILTIVGLILLGFVVSWIALWQRDLVLPWIMDDIARTLIVCAMALGALTASGSFIVNRIAPV